MRSVILNSRNSLCKIIVWAILATFGVPTGAHAAQITAPTVAYVGSTASFSVSQLVGTFNRTSPVTFSYSGATNTGFGTQAQYAGSASGTNFVQTFNDTFTTPTLLQPGTVQVGGGSYTMTRCDQAGCTFPPNYPAPSSAYIQVQYTPAYKAQHQLAANASLFGYIHLQNLSIFQGALSVGTHISNAVAYLVGIILNCGQGCYTVGLGTVLAAGLAIAIAPAVAVFLGASSTAAALVSLLLATVSALAGAYLYLAYQTHTLIAHDPPDPNYTQIYQAGPAVFATDLGLGAGANAKFQQGVTVLGGLLDSEKCILTSTEREQGAVIAGDMGWAVAQTSAGQKCAEEASAYALAASQWFEDLPPFLDPYLTGAGLSGSDTAELYQSLRDIGANVVSPSNVDLPESDNTWLFGFGLVGLVVASRRLRYRQTARANRQGA